MDQNVLRVFTSFIKAVLENLLDGLLCGLEGVLPPGLPVVTAEDDDLSLAASQGGEVRDLDDDGAEELGAGGAELEHAGGDGLALHQGRRVDQLVLLQIPAQTTPIMTFSKQKKKASKNKNDKKCLNFECSIFICKFFTLPRGKNL